MKENAKLYNFIKVKLYIGKTLFLIFWVLIFSHPKCSAMPKLVCITPCLNRPTEKSCIYFVYKNCTICIQLMCTKCIQDGYIENVSHILTNFCIHFVYRVKRTMAA